MVYNRLFVIITFRSNCSEKMRLPQVFEPSHTVEALINRLSKLLIDLKNTQKCLFRQKLGQIPIQKASKCGQAINSNSFNSFQTSGQGRPEQITCTKLIKTSETFPIFWVCIFCHVKIEKILDP